jgi:cytochrome P450
VLNKLQRDVLQKRHIILKKLELNTVEDKTPNRRNILIDHIILNEEKFSREEIRDHILTFLGGYETLGIALAHATLLLAMNPEVQDKLHEEIQKKILSDKDLTSEVISKIEYLDLVLKEVLRLLPTVPIIMRETLDDFEMEPGMIIPKNTCLVINFLTLHRQPSIWGDDAEEFNPERFLPKNCINRNPFAYLPFSSGPRICIAYKYSIFALKIAIAKLMLRFKFTTSIKKKNIHLKSYVTLKLCTKHLMKLEKR